MNSLRILAIVPAYNEAEIIANTVKEIQDKAPGVDVLVVNDGSSDCTMDVLRDMEINCLNLRRNLGIGGAVQSGYIYAKENEYDYTVQIDGDGQHDPSYILPIIKMMEEEGQEYVIGSRFIEKRGFQSSKARRVGIRFLSMLIRMISGADIKDVTSGYRVANRRFIDIFAKDYADDYPEPDAILTVASHHGIMAEYPVVMKERLRGISSIGPGEAVYYMTKVSLSILMHRLMRSGGR